MDIKKAIDDRLHIFDLSPEQVDRRAMLPEGTVSKILSGVTPDLADLCRLGRVLVFDAYALVRGDDISDPSRSPVRFKTPEGAESPLAPEDVLLLARAAELGRSGGWLLDLLGRDCAVLSHRQVLPISETKEPWKQGYELGEKARAALTADPAAPLPSVQKVLESLGVHVALVELGRPEITAASIVEPGGLPVILLNGRSARARSRISRRAAVAHELCHLLHDGGDRSLAVVSAAGGAPDQFEQRANGFAPAFIAPKREVRKQFRAPLHPCQDGEARRVVVDLSRRWGLSPTGAVWHAKNCGLISSVQADRLATEDYDELDLPFEQEVQRREIPEELTTSDLATGLYSDLAVEVLKRDEISLERAAELLRI